VATRLKTFLKTFFSNPSKEEEMNILVELILVGHFDQTKLFFHPNVYDPFLLSYNQFFNPHLIFLSSFPFSVNLCLLVHLYMALVCRPFVFLFVCSFVYLSICLLDCLFICLFVHLSICPLVYLCISIRIKFFVHLFICPFVYLPICISVHLSICPLVYLFHIHVSWFCPCVFPCPLE